MLKISRFPDFNLLFLLLFLQDANVFFFMWETYKATS